MKNVFEWFESTFTDREKPWLILGKGPSYVLKDQINLSEYWTLSLNHVVREQPVTIAHMIDFDVAEACADALEQNAKVVVMPWYPHVNNQVGTRPLPELVSKVPALVRLNNQGRLLWYNLSTASHVEGDFPVVRATYFSSEAAIDLLAKAGFRHIRSLGVDGGTSYSSHFKDLKTLLSNGHASFDKQFRGIAETLRTTGVDYSPLDIESPVRVYVGCSPSEILPVKVLEYSIKKHASLSVEVFPLFEADIPYPMPKDKQNQPRTPFSFQRLLIPQLAGYRGKAIYMDSDMQVFKDIRNLWTSPFDGADLLSVPESGNSKRRSQYSVILMDCNRLKWDIQDIVRKLDAGELTYEQLMYDMALAEEIHLSLDPAWNCLERFDKKQTALIHYTDMPGQPWVATSNKNGHLWISDLLEALDTGFLSMDFVNETIEKGYTRPSLAFQLKYRYINSRALPREVKAMDNGFVAPYQAILQRAGGTTVKPRKSKGLFAGLKRLPLFAKS